MSTPIKTRWWHSKTVTVHFDQQQT